jgi:hypothetical protein
MRQIYYEDDTVKFEYELEEGNLFLHALVFKWSHSIFKRHLEIFAKFLNEAKENGFKCVYTATPNRRYVELMGGVDLNKSVNVGGKKLEIFLWVL